MTFGNKYSGKQKHIVSIGGGLSSTVELPLEVIRRYGVENVDFVTCALAGESPDLWRLVDWLEAKTGKHVTRVAWIPNERWVHHGLKRDYWIDAPTWAYSDIWDVFMQEGLMGNSRLDPCSRILKRETFRKFLVDHYDAQQTTVHVGIQSQEIDRMLSIHRNYNKLGYDVQAVLADDEYLNSKPVDWHAMTTAQQCKYAVGFVPFVYSWGRDGAHNNCGGFCVKSGLGHLLDLLRFDRQTFLYHEQRELEFQRVHNTSATIFFKTETLNSKTRKLPITMQEFRLMHDTQKELPFVYEDNNTGCNFCEAA